MWRRVEVKVTLDHPVDRVFPYLADPMRWHEFAPAVARRCQTTKGSPRVGTRWAATDRIGPFKIHFVDELIRHEQDHRVAWRSSAPWNAVTEYVCHGERGRTRVHARYEGDIASWLRLLGWVPTPVIAWILAGDFRRLRRRLAAAEQR